MERAEACSISLNGDWTLYYAPEKGGKPDCYTPSLVEQWPCVPARVPGNVELELVRAGVERDPFYGENLTDFAPYEYYQWVYVRTFDVPADLDGEQQLLRFDGLDTFADVYLNDVWIGSAANMLIEHTFDVTGQVRRGARNQLAVHLHAAMNRARGRAYPVALRGTGHRNEICWLRKAPHSFGWDIAPRLVSAGLWRGVSLVGCGRTRLTETYYATPELTPEGDIWLQYAYRFTTDHDTLEGFRVRVVGSCGDEVFMDEQAAHFVSANHALRIRAPKLWWPAGYGGQPLYTMRMELLYHGQLVDRIVERIGLRTLRLERRFTPGDQAFQLFVNDTRIFAKGTNWVPLDALHSRDADRLNQAHALCVEAGCNMVRCWGGNVYEDHAFFDLCDQTGILVWQDFAMGNTNYPQTEDFAAMLEQELGSVIRKLRNHPSLALWSGDNEVDFKNMGYQYPAYASRYNRVAQELLPRLVQAHDPYRVLIPSSPEVPDGFTTDNVPEQHTWGARAWYKDDFYKHAAARFISEAGYHGCPAPSSLRRFLPPEQLWPLDNRAWAMHSTEDVRIEPTLNGRNELMRNQVRLLFGEAPDTLEDFALLSQISQAEALKFFIERSRAKKWERTGILWWNMLDCWPQISDAAVDYYFTKKLAFSYVKRAQRPVLLFVGELEGWEYPLLFSNDTRAEAAVEYTVTDGDTERLLASGRLRVPAGENRTAGALRLPAGEQRLLLLRWTVGGVEYGNHYITGFPPYRPAQMRDWLRKICTLPEPFKPALLK